MKKFLKQLGWTALLGLGLLTGCSSDDEVVEPVVVNPKDASIRELVEQEELYNGQTVRTFGKVVAISDHDYIENLNPQHDVTIRILNTFLHKVDLFRTYSLEKADKAGIASFQSGMLDLEQLKVTRSSLSAIGLFNNGKIRYTKLISPSGDILFERHDIQPQEFRGKIVDLNQMKYSSAGGSTYYQSTLKLKKEDDKFFSFVFNLASLNAYNKYINSNVVVKCTQELINNKSFVGEEIEYIMPKPPELDKKKRAFWQKLGGAEVSAELKELYSAIGKEEALFKDIKKQDRELTFGAAMVVYDESKRIWDLAVANNCKELIDISVDLTKEAAYSMVNLKEYGLAAEMFKSRAMDETGYGVITSGIYSLSVDGRHYDAARLAQSYRLDDDVATQYDKCIDRLLDRALWAEAWDVIQEANSGFEYREKIAEIKEELSEKQQKFAVGDSVHTYVDYALQNNKNARFYGPSIKDFYGRIVSFPDIGRAEINGWHVTANDTTQFKGIVPVDRMKKKKD